MHEMYAILGIITALTVGVISPGPSFVFVARTAVSTSRSEGIAAALGMGIGGLVFAVAALLGLQSILLAVPSVYLSLKIVGGLYLTYLGFKILNSANKPMMPIGFEAGKKDPKNIYKALILGFTAQISNPKTAIVYASVFATFLPAAPSFGFNLAVIAFVFIIEAGWYALVALVLSSQGSQAVYLRYKCWMDRVAGGVLAALGLNLAWSAIGHK